MAEGIYIVLSIFSVVGLLALYIGMMMYLDKKHRRKIKEMIANGKLHSITGLLVEHYIRGSGSDTEHMIKVFYTVPFHHQGDQDLEPSSTPRESSDELMFLKTLKVDQNAYDAAVKTKSVGLDYLEGFPKSAQLHRYFEYIGKNIFVIFLVGMVFIFASALFLVFNRSAMTSDSSSMTLGITWGASLGAIVVTAVLLAYWCKSRGPLSKEPISSFIRRDTYHGTEQIFHYPTPKDYEENRPILKDAHRRRSAAEKLLNKMKTSSNSATQQRNKATSNVVKVTKKSSKKISSKSVVYAASSHQTNEEADDDSVAFQC